MIQGRFDWRTLLGVLVALGIGLALTLSTLSGVRTYHLVELEGELRARGELLAAALAGLPADQAAALLARVDAAEGDLALCWEGPDGASLHASDLLRQVAAPAPRPTTVLVRRLDEPGGTWVQAVLPLEDGGLLGVARPLALAEERSAALHARVLRLTVPVGVIGLGLGVLWVLRVKRSIRDVTGFVSGILRGGVGPRLPARGSGSIGELCRAVNRLAWEVESHDLAVEREMAHRRAVLASMDDGVVAVDEDQVVLAVNRTVLEQLKFTDPEPEGQHLWEVIRQPEALALVERCLAEQRRVSRRVEVPAVSGGRALSLELRASPIVDPQGGGCVLVVTDRTEIEHLERVRQDFVANVSHELKTPLTSVHGYLETIREDEDMPPKVRDRFLKKALKNSRRLSSIVTDLLSLARAESAGATLESAPVRLVALAHEIQEASLGLALDSGIQVDVARGQGVVRGGDCIVLGDRAALALALGNLVENAIKYSPAGTRVQVLVHERDGVARIEVTDQGPGIAAEHQERLFERFYRVDKERSRELGGTGLGLSIVRNVVVTHGGEVGVTSTPGEGSTFWLELPMRGGT